MPSAISGSTTPVSANIQHYLAQATLPRLRLASCTPRMPEGNHKAHRNVLKIRPERHRRLRCIHRLKQDYLDVRCLDFVQNHVPSFPVEVGDLDPDAYEQPCVPCEGFHVEGVGSAPLPLKHIDGFRTSWFEDCILRTVQAVLHMIPEYRNIAQNYAFTCNDILCDEDQGIFRYFLWERTDPAGTMPNPVDPPVKFIIAYQPPWILPPREIELFADKRLRSLPSFDVCDSGEKRYTSTHKVWAKLWDICKMHNCSKFVLTNYNQWVFGGFSRGWEHGYTMGVREANVDPRPDPKGKQPLSRIPTILELLVYWTVSSMRLPDSFEVPPVPDEIALDMAIDDSGASSSGSVTPVQANFVPPAASIASTIQEPSESDWSSQRSRIPSSAGVRFDFDSDSCRTPPGFLTENWNAPKPRAATRQNATTVTSWLKKSPNDPNGPPPFPLPSPGIPFPPSPVMSTWSDRSLATRRPRRNQGMFDVCTIIIEEVVEYDFDQMDLT